jgi:hypothetical protein
LQIPHHLHAQSSEVKLEMMGRMLADFAYDSIGLDPAESSDGSVMTVSEACAAVTKRISDFQAGR